MGHSRVLIELVIVLGTAAVTTVLFHALRLPVVLGYVLAGLVIGPHVPIPLVADAGLVSVLSELGVILLMFTIGLELRVRTIARLGPSAALTAVFEVGLMVSIGLGVAGLLGWSATEALFCGACVGISSTMLVAKAFEEVGVKDRFTELVFAVLVFEDLIAILLLAVLTAVASGTGLSPRAVATTVGQLAGFLALLVVGGLLVVPRAVAWIARLERPETLLIGGLGLCFAMAALADAAGYSVALGAFVAGVLAAESGRGHDLQQIVRPFRDVFAAIFFVSIGMSIEPALIADNWLAIVVLTVAVWLGKPLGVGVGMFLTGNGLRPAVRSGVSMAQIGELSFVIAGVGIQGGVVGAYLLPVAVGVSCATALTTPWLVRASDRIADRVAAGLPRRIATFVSLYESWLERARAARDTPLRRGLRRPIAVLVADALIIAVIVIVTATAGRRLAVLAAARTGLSETAALAVVVGAAVLLALFFLIGLIRRAAIVARLIAVEVIPRRPELDLGLAPRRALVLMLELGIALVVGIPLAALTQPFVPGGAAIVLIAIALIVLATRRSIVDLDEHVRAGSALIVEVLGARHAADAHADADSGTERLAEVQAMMPGLSGVVTIALPDAAPAIGRSLAELDLRARTGATVLAIQRGDTGTASPAPRDPLQAGDVLALAGSEPAIEAARAVLLDAPQSQ